MQSTQPTPSPSGDEHYFTAHDRARDDERVVRTITLAGQQVQVETAPGVFSHQHLDVGTALLLDTVIKDAAFDDVDTALDLGCGWGPIALTLGLQQPAGPAATYAVDVNERALDLTRRNAQRLGLSTIVTGYAADIPHDVTFDLIVSNPPIRIGKAALHDLLHAWIPRLTPGGVAYLVVAKKLGSDSLQQWLTASLRGQQADSGITSMQTGTGAIVTGTVERINQAKGFRVLRISRDISES